MTSLGRPANPRHAGFSLLELLVTLIVVVMITALVTLNVGSGGRDMRLEGQLRDLAGVAAYALDEAQMMGVDYGLVVYQESVEGELIYVCRWLERQPEPEGWGEPSTGKEIFSPLQLPANVELELELEGAPLNDLAPEENTQATPQVVFYASGEVATGALDVRRRDSGELLWRLEWDLLGRFELTRGGEI